MLLLIMLRSLKYTEVWGVFFLQYYRRLAFCGLNFEVKNYVARNYSL